VTATLTGKYSEMSWQELRNLARDRGINTFKMGRVEVEARVADTEAPEIGEVVPEVATEATQAPSTAVRTTRVEAKPPHTANAQNIVNQNGQIIAMFYNRARNTEGEWTELDMADNVAQALKGFST